MDVIPLILSEEAADVLPMDYLYRLSECSTNVIKYKVLAYLDNPDADPVIRKKVQDAYSEQLLISEYLQSEDLAKDAEKVQSLSYSSVTPYLSIEELVEYKRAISAILGNKYAVPYVAPISGALVKDLCEDIYNLYKETDDTTINDFYKKLKKHASLFRESQFASYKGTVVKKIIRDRGKYEVILRGIEFMIEKKKSCSLPASWRYL